MIVSDRVWPIPGVVFNSSNSGFSFTRPTIVFSKRSICPSAHWSMAKLALIANARSALGTSSSISLLSSLLTQLALIEPPVLRLTDFVCSTSSWFFAAPSDRAYATDRARGGVLWDRYILGVRFPAVTDAPASGHQRGRRCT